MGDVPGPRGGDWLLWEVETGAKTCFRHVSAGVKSPGRQSGP